MLKIRSLSQSPSARDICIRWADAEWGDVAGFSLEDWDEEYTRIETHPTDEVFVAFQDDTPVGMVWMLEHEGVESHMHLTPWLSSLVVDPDYRDAGIAGALMAHLEAYVEAGGDEVLYLLTETPAIYFTHGWEVKDTAPLGDKDVFVMQKGLAALRLTDTA
jgi:GNAT superfamily N-acetyltransferase